MNESYRMPAEWEPHEATWLAWPHNIEDWPGKFTPIPWVYCEIIRRLVRVEKVHLLVQDATAEKKARRTLEKAHVPLNGIVFFHCLTDRSWLRDTCPIFVKNPHGALVATNWRFNGWAKYDNWQVDDAVAEFVARALGVPECRPMLGEWRLVLEGGSIEVNGRGTMLTTEECLLSPVQARNPGLSREDLEQVFAKYFGVSKVLWLKNGIAGDDTHGHIDDLARFVDPGTVVVASEENRSDRNYEPLRENLELLRGMTDQDGRPLEVVTLPMPEPVWFDNQLLPASYVNFYIANRLVLVPTFNDPKDREVLNTLARLFPGREVVGINCVDLVLGLGTLHCMSQQQPAV